MLGPTLDEIGYHREFAGTSSVERLQSQLHVAPYLLRFGARQWLKSNTVLGRRFADLSLFAPPPPDAVHPMPPTAQLKL
jgi:hypothetical protein